MYYNIIDTKIITNKKYSGTPEAVAKKIWREHKNLTTITFTNIMNVIENQLNTNEFNLIDESDIHIFYSKDWCLRSNPKKFKK